MKNNTISLYDKLEKYSESDYYPYHMPGHKRQTRGQIPDEWISADITEIEGFDNLHQPEDILYSLQHKAAALYGAEESFYLVNGSTGGILSAVSAAVPEGGTLLIPRNSHKSAYHAAYLRNLTINYLYPPVIKEYDIYDAVQPEQIRRALEADSTIQAVFVVSPTYEGRIADIRAIADIVHERGIPLIVDEAHGAHLGWAEEFAENSCRLGADIVIHSVHKTLPALTQTALLHVNGARIDRHRLKRFLQIYQTSSPSYLLMASIDDALSLLEEKGRTLFAVFYRQYLSMLEVLSSCKHLRFLPLVKGQQDVGKLLISGKRAGLSGQQIYEILLQRYHLQLEMAAGSYCLAMFTVGDTPQAYGRMQQALVELDEECGRNAVPAADSPEEWKAEPLPGIPLQTAWELPWELMDLEHAQGRYAADFISLYPPGSPLAVPGEQLTKEAVAQIKSYLEKHLKVQGIQQEEGCKVKCIKIEAVKKWNGEKIEN